MKEHCITPAGGWEQWTENQKSALRDGMTERRVGCRLAFENGHIRVWTIHLSPGEWLHFHKHDMPYYWTALSAGRARSRRDDGSVWVVEYEVGDTKYFAELAKDTYFVHDVLNIGESPLVFSTVELLR